jgi:putative flippase GtrA
MFIKDILSFEINRFLVIGFFNTLVGYLFFTVFFYLANNEHLALLLSYVFGILLNYKTYSKYVFKNSNQKIFTNFIILYISIFIFNNYLLYLIENTIQVNLYIAQLFAISIVTPLLYILNKKYVFIEKKEF